MSKAHRFRAQLFLPRMAGKSAVGASRALEDNPALQAIWDIIGAIPRGAASTYGSVARAAGLPGRARLAGYALKWMPDDLHLPWYRVVGAGGRIAFPKGSAQQREQARLLRAEGVILKNGRVQPQFMTDLEDL